MSGSLFPDVGPVSLHEWRSMTGSLYSRLFKAGATNVVPVGSTGLDGTMGDIDLAVECPAGRDGLMAALRGDFEVRKTGNDLVAIRYPVGGNRWVQIDLMVGDIRFLRWARAGSTDAGIKNSCRAVLLNVILRFLSESIDTTSYGEEMNWSRKRYLLDFGSGLYIANQTRRGKTGMLKQWKTLDRRLVTSDPHEIVEIMFGREFNEMDTRSFSGVIDALKRSPKWQSGNGQLVRSTFLLEVAQLETSKPGSYGDMVLIERLVRG